MRRRDLLIAAAAAAAAPRLAATGGAPELVVYDGRFAEAEGFGRAAQRRGVQAFDARGDVARLWYGPLKTARRDGQQARISGLTTWADFQVLAGCAAEARIRPVRHRFLPDRQLVSWTIG